MVQCTAMWLGKMSLSLMNFIMITGQMAPSQWWAEISQRRVSTLSWYPGWAGVWGRREDPDVCHPHFGGKVSLFTAIKSWPHWKLQFYLPNKCPRILSDAQLSTTQPKGILPFLPSMPQLHGPMKWWRAWGWLYSWVKHPNTSSFQVSIGFPQDKQLFLKEQYP